MCSPSGDHDGDALDMTSAADTRCTPVPWIQPVSRMRRGQEVRVSGSKPEQQEKTGIARDLAPAKSRALG
jgi:hypothetical protein